MAKLKIDVGQSRRAMVYARALFELALEKEQLVEYCRQAECVLAEADGDLMTVLKHPLVTSAEKTRLLEDAFSSVLAPDVMGLICLAVRKNREAELPEILRGFIALAKEHMGIVEARVYSATELSAEQTRAITERLSQKLNKAVTVVTEVDPGLIGGLRITVSGHEMDGTVRTQLERMKGRLLNEAVPSL